MLKVDLGDLERRRTLRVEGKIEADDDFFEGLEFVFQEPFNVVLNAAWAGSGELVVRGGVVGAVFQDCRRCLDRVEQRIDVDISLLFAPSDLLDRTFVRKWPSRYPRLLNAGSTVAVYALDVVRI